MTTYQTLDKLISSTYAVDTGLSEEQAEKLYLRMLENEAWRDKLAAEVEAAFLDESFSWSEFFERHDVYSAENEFEARQYAERIIRAPLQTK
jgi:hypothetical protein